MERPPGQAHLVRGFSVIEVTMVLAVVVVLGSLAVGSLLALRAEARAVGAARYLAARVSEERAAALRRGVAGGLFFTRSGGRYVFQHVLDGNGNGLRSEEVASGVDRLVDGPLALDHLFPGVDFSVRRPVPAVDGEGPGFPEGADPIRIGGTRFLSFGASGTGTSGTLYLGTAAGRQLAVRVFGTTGRVRVFEFIPAQGRWVAR